jgi:hypothetical protein
MSTRPVARTRLVAIGLVGVLLVAACNGDDGAADPAPPATADAVSEPTTSPTSPPVTEPLPTISAPEPEPELTTPPPEGDDSTTWHELDLGEDCVCADGAPLTFYERRASTEQVVLFFQGGGACFSADTCAFGDGTYTVDPGGVPRASGIFDFDRPDNPIAEYSVVYVPYCTGDIHIGNATTQYSDTLTVRHNGFVNGSKALEHLAARYPDAREVLVTGVSAGSVPTPLFAGLASDLLPDARITALGDGSGAYGDNPGVNTVIGSLWGTESVVPDWPVNDGLTVDQLSPPVLWVQAGRHAPEIIFARFDFAYDDVQVFFAAITGGGGGDLLEAIEANDARIEADGVDVVTFTAPGSAHTIVTSSAFYDLEVEGVRLIEWFTDLIGGAPVTDVRCTDCQG